MTTIYSGYYTHNNQPPQWVQHATKAHQNWTNKINATYHHLTNMHPWDKHYPIPHSWTFGSLIKLKAIEHYLQNPTPTFIWIDQDIYPTPNAHTTPIPQPNTYQYWTDNTPHHQLNQFKQNKQNKQKWVHTTWTNPNNQPYNTIATGILILNHQTTQNLWNHINQHHNINTPQWWNHYHQKQQQLDPQNPWNYGNDEAIIEEWHNQTNPKTTYLPNTYHSCHPSPHNPTLLHYHGNQKDNYPTN